VLSYEQDELTLLHLRNNWNGEYARHEVLADLSETYNVPLVNTFDVQNVDSFLSSYKDVSGVEGWVIQFKDGDMVKLKTEEYTKHHRMITFVRERDVAELILDEKIDDVKAAFVERGLNLEKMLDVEKRVVSMLNEMREEVESTHEQYKELSRKDFAVKFSGHRYFGLLMKKFTGTEPDYVYFFKDKLLKQEFSLISV
jgi:T4 RnlA family RNA ligase